MRTTFLAVLIVAAAPAAVSAQSASSSPPVMALTLDEAVRLASEHNLELNAERLDPQISDTRVAAAVGAFRPALNTGLQRNNQLLPPSNFLFPVPTRNDAVTSTAGVSQQLPWFGTSYSLAWNATHTESNSFLSSYNPLLQSGLSLSISQPLARNLAIDPAREQLALGRVNRAVADTRLREAVVHTVAAVKSAYWNLVSAIAWAEARRSALALAEELARVNKARVDVGQSPPLDLTSAQAEVASNQEQLIIAETSVKQAEDRLRMLIFDSSRRDVWSIKLDPVDSPLLATTDTDVEAAITRALRNRADLVRARKDLESSDILVKFAGSQRLPDVRVNASYLASGLGGTQVLRSGGFPGTIVGSGGITSIGSVLGQLFERDYPTWALGVSVSYPLGGSTDEANYARAQLERNQSDQWLKSAEARTIQQLREAWWKIEMNSKRMDTTRSARQLADARLDSERKRFDVGMSTSFLVIQAQRDLAQAKTNELAAVLAYDLALVDFEALQEAGPAGQSAAPVQAASTPAAATQAQAAQTTTRSSSILAGIPGIQ
jgi:outer membrane protein